SKGVYSPFLWRDSGGVKRLPSFGPAGLNDSDEVIGVSLVDKTTDSVRAHAVRWTEREGLQDLNDLIPVNSGWELCFANGINDTGQIVGQGSLHGLQRAFLLTPRRGKHRPVHHNRPLPGTSACLIHQR